MIKLTTVDEIYKFEGFEEMVQEYGQLSASFLPPATYKREDYKPIEDAGLLAAFCALDKGKIVGFAACIRAFLPHYGITAAQVESLYVLRAYRQNGYGIRLIEACEDFARVERLNPLLIQVHEEELERLGIVLNRRNYSACYRTFGRWL